MTRKVKQSVMVAEKWLDYTSCIIEQFIKQNPQLEKNKRIRENIVVCLYIVYDMLFKTKQQRDLRTEYFTINYHSLKVWSQMGNNFPQFFRFLLDKNVLKRWESQNINPKTGRPFAYYYHSIGAKGICAQYKFNEVIIKAIQNQPEVNIQITVSEKNDYFFHTVSKAKKKLDWWKRNDVYGDFREPNEYELKVMDRLKQLQIAEDLVEGQIEPVFIHGRIYQNGWTNLSKEFRTTVKLNGQQLAEVFDVRNCYVQFTAAKLEECGQVDQVELKDFCEKAYSGKFYQFLAEGTEYDREQMKQPWMHFLFSSSGTKKRGLASQNKEYELQYIARWNVVKDKVKKSYPSIYKFLLSYPQIEVEGRKVSVDLQWIENKYVLNGLMKMLEQKEKVKEPISLHDGIYLTEDQVTKQSKQFFEVCWKMILNKHIRKNDVEHVSTPVSVQIPVKTEVKSERETIRKWLTETNTSKEHMKEFDEEEKYYDLFKLAYEFGTGKIKSCRT